MNGGTPIASLTILIRNARHLNVMCQSMMLKIRRLPAAAANFIDAWADVTATQVALRRAQSLHYVPEKSQTLPDVVSAKTVGALTAPNSTMEGATKRIESADRF